MNSMEVSGKSVDEAIFNGLIKMGKTIDEVEIEIVNSGNKGLFGIGKSAIVKLTERNFFDPSPENIDNKSDVAPKPIRTAARTSSFEPKATREPRRAQAPRQQAEAVPEEPFEAVIAEHGAAQFLDGIITRMGMKASIAVSETDEELVIDLSGPHMGKLIGRRGETLDALQYLCSLYVNHDKQDYKRVVLDTENYRDKRKSTLIKLADKMARRVLKTGRKVVLEPMNPYERRILHSTLQEHDGVVTYSQGEDPNRKVVIDLDKGQEG